MGVVPQGTFNCFACTHGIPVDPTEAVGLLLRSTPVPVQVAGVNDRVFLVNASLGLYPDLLEDREACKARFGRSRWVAFVAARTTLLRAQRRLRVHIGMGGAVRDVQTLTLFVGNNRLQLQQFGAEPEDTVAGTPGDGSVAALMLRPIGTLPMIEGCRGVKVAFDGEVTTLRVPLDFRVLAEPLYLLAPPRGEAG